jgi:group I intron endonuclease
MIIYKTTNTINGKIYIGKDKINNPKYFGSGKILHLAFEKFGIENFKKEVLEECNSLELLNEREIFWINYYNSTNRLIGYNIALGGCGGNTISNHPNKEEIAKKHSEWMYENNPKKGKKRTPEEIKKWKESYGDKSSGQNNPMYGKKHKDSTKQLLSNIRKQWHENLSDIEREIINNKISKSNKGKKGIIWSDEMKKAHSEWMKINNPFKGKTHTDEVKKMLSEINKKPKSEETKRKLSEANKGNKPGNMVCVEVEGIVYESLTDASRKTGINLSTLRNRIKSKNIKYKNYKIYEESVN